MKDNLIVTIGRQFGSGGREIGQKVAQLLNLKYYDRELILEASKISGLCTEHFERADEKAPNRFINALSMGWISGASGIPSTGGLTDEVIFKVQSDVIRNIAETQSAVIVGRCADYILREYPHCCNIFIHAPLQDRIQRIIDRNKDKVSARQAEEIALKRNKIRATYYNFYTDKTWGDAASYDLCIDSSLLGCEATARLIASFVEQRFAGRK